MKKNKKKSTTQTVPPQDSYNQLVEVSTSSLTTDIGTFFIRITSSRHVKFKSLLTNNMVYMVNST